MGHQIEFKTFEYTESQQTIMNLCNKYAEHYSDSGHGLYSNIQFMKDRVFNTYNEAQDFLEGLHGDYVQAAVLFYSELPMDNKQLLEKQKKLKELRVKLYTLEREQHYTPQKVQSKFIGCKHCESRIAVQYLRSNYCPVCRMDLRPKTTQDRITALKKSCAELEAQLCKLEHEVAAKAVIKATAKGKKPKMQWLVRIEFHT